MGGAETTAPLNVCWSAVDDMECPPSGSAAADDYSPLRGMVTFAVGSVAGASMPVAVTVTDDSLNEGEEMLTLTLMLPAGDPGGGRPAGFPMTAPTAALDTAMASKTIAASDPIMASVARADTDGFEEGGAAGAGTAIFEVTLAGGRLSADASVAFTLSGAAPSDYTVMPSGGLLTFAASDSTDAVTVAEIEVTAVDDAESEAAETLTVTLSGITVAAGGGGVELSDTAAAREAAATIAASDPVTVSVAGPDMAVMEGTDAVFTVTVTGTPAAEIRLPYTLSGAGIDADDVAAAALTDIAALRGEATLAASATSFTVGIRDDGRAEPQETLTLSLGAPAGGGAAGGIALAAAADAGTATATIADGGVAERSFSLAGPAVLAEGESATYTVRYGGSMPLDAEATVAVSVAGTGAAMAAAADFAGSALPSATLIFAQGVAAGAAAAVGTLMFTVADDMLSEPAEGFQVSVAISGGSTAVLVNERVASAIAASDPVTVTSVAGPAMPVAEGAAASFELSLSGGELTAAATIPYRIGGVAASDIMGGLRGELTVASGTAATATLVLTVLADGLNEDAETLTLTLGAPAGGGGGLALAAGAGTATATIAASDPVTVAVAVPSGSATVNEGGIAEFAVTLAGAAMGSAAAATVPYTINADSGTAMAADYEDLGGGSLTIPAGATMGVIRVRAVLDSVVAGAGGEGATESLVVTLGTPVLGAGGGEISLSLAVTAAVTLQDVNTMTMRVVSVTGPTEIREGGVAEYAVSVVGAATDRALLVPFAVTGAAAGGAMAADVDDFDIVLPGGVAGSATSATLTLAGGARAGVIALRIARDDGMPEAAERLTLTLQAPAGGDAAGSNNVLGVASAATVIAGAADLIQVSLSGGAQVVEGREAEFTVRLAGDTPTALVDVPYTVTATGGAEPGVDYEVLGSGSLRFLPGSGALGFRVRTVADEQEETGEGFEVRLEMPAYGGIGRVVLGTSVLAVTIAETPEDAPGPRTERLEQTVAALNATTVALATRTIRRRFDPGAALSAPGLTLHVNGRQIFSSGAAGAAASGAEGIGLASAEARTLQEELNTTPAASGQAGVSVAAAAGSALAGGALPGNAGDGAARDDAAWDDPYAGATTGDLRSLSQILGSSNFSVTSNDGDGRLLALWGSATHTRLDGQPEEAGRVLSYAGDSQAYYMGAERRYDGRLAGAALGYVTGDVEVKDPMAPGGRTTVKNNMLMVHPYISWRRSDTLNMWLLGGLGTGDVRLAERGAGGAMAHNTSAASLLMAAGGLSWLAPSLSVVEKRLRLSASVFRGEVDGGALSGGRTYGDVETEASQLRGEIELARPFSFASGMLGRPFLTAGMAYDFGDTERDAGTGEFSAGFDLVWPELGLETQLEGQLRITNEDQSRRSYREYSITGFVRYDRGGDGRGLRFALQPSLGLARAPGALNGSALNGSLAGGAAGGVGASALGAASGGGAMALGLSSEMSYGIGAARLWNAPGLFTLYGNSGLSQGALNYGSGLRFEAQRFSLDAGATRQGAASGGASDYEFLLEGVLRF